MNEDHRIGPKLHGCGLASVFRPPEDFNFEEFVGVVEDGVLFMYEPEEVRGFVLTPKQARKLALELSSAATFCELREKGLIVEKKKP